MGIINTNNNISIDKHFCVSWYTKQFSDLSNGQQWW